MPLALDHLVIAVDNLNTAIRDYRELGFTVVRGGIHANRATHNALVIFTDGTYLELLAATGEDPLPGVIDFGTLLGHGEGLVGFALRSDDLEADVVRLRADNFAVGAVIPGERRRDDGTVIQWKLALLDDGFNPFLIQDVTPRTWRVPADPALTTHANQALGLQSVTLATPDLTAKHDRFARLLDMTPAPDSTDTFALGCIVLRASDQDSVAPVRLTAAQIRCELTESVSFPAQLTHGVRFEPIRAD